MKKIIFEEKATGDVLVYGVINNEFPSFISDENLPLKKYFKSQSLEMLWGQIHHQSYLFIAFDNNNESIRQAVAKAFKELKKKKVKKIVFDAISFKNQSKIIAESCYLASYDFTTYKKESLDNPQVVIQGKSLDLTSVEIITSCVNEARGYGDEAPNVLNSETYSEMLKKSLESLPIKVKILTRKEIEQENMHLFLAVNKASSYEPRFLHAVYEPEQYKKHIALVGKGLTFDTGGYSLKPGNAMMTMKFDMCGSATVFSAFKAAVQLKSQVKLSLFIPMTDNTVSGTGITPDSIVKSRSGQTVEILNTDAEGRLILADALDFACDQHPDIIIDAATLTGAVIVALGDQVTGVMTNNQDLVESFLKVAKEQDEYVWQLPLVKEHYDDMKSPNADLKNIGSAGKGGTVTAGAFLGYFIKNNIPWLHFDIAGTASEQKHLHYCTSHGASGLLIRSLISFIQKHT